MTGNDIDPIQFDNDERPELLVRVDTPSGPYYSESTDPTAPLLPGGTVVGVGIKDRGEETYGTYGFKGFRERVERIYEHVIWFEGGEP